MGLCTSCAGTRPSAADPTRSRAAYPPPRLSVNLFIFCWRLGGQTGRLGGWTGRLGGQTGRLEVLEARLGVLEARLNVLKAGPGVLEAGLGVLEARLSVVEARLGVVGRPGSTSWCIPTRFYKFFRVKTRPIGWKAKLLLLSGIAMNLVFLGHTYLLPRHTELLTGRTTWRLGGQTKRLGGRTGPFSGTGVTTACL